jgi:hypothetical protein
VAKVLRFWFLFVCTAARLMPFCKIHAVSQIKLSLPRPQTAPALSHLPTPHPQACVSATAPCVFRPAAHRLARWHHQALGRSLRAQTRVCGARASVSFACCESAVSNCRISLAFGPGRR